MRWIAILLSALVCVAVVWIGVHVVTAYLCAPPDACRLCGRLHR